MLPDHADSLPSIRKVAVEGLFGLFNHDVELDKEGITIVHGPNGVGKTRLLQMTSALPRLEHSVFARTPFSRFWLETSDGSRLAIQPADGEVELPIVHEDSPRGRRQKRGVQQANPLLILSLEQSGSPVTQTLLPLQGVEPEVRLMRQLEMEIPFLRRVGPSEWVDRRTDRAINVFEVADEFGHYIPSSLLESLYEEIERLHEGAPAVAFARSLRVHFIDTQRLRTEGQPYSRADRARRPDEVAPTVPTVEVIAESLSAEIEKYLTNFAAKSATMERTFPVRALWEGEAPSDLTDEQVRERYEQVTALRDRITSAGILEREGDIEWPDRHLNPTERHFLNLYLKDTEDKLLVFHPLLEKLEAFADTLDQRFLYKQLYFDRDQGIRFETPTADEIPLLELSSGEQHEVVFAYEMLFQAEPGALVLIDEPELSLHVSWQQRFLKDLQRIRDVTEVDFLIATHAPQIIHDRWDLAKSLGGSGG